MNLNSLLIGIVAGTLTFIITQQITPIIVTNTLLGILIGLSTSDRNKKNK